MNTRKRARVEDDDPWGESASEGRSDGEEDQEEEEEEARVGRARAGAAPWMHSARRSRRARPRGFTPAASRGPGSSRRCARFYSRWRLARRTRAASARWSSPPSPIALDLGRALCASLGLATDRLDGRAPRRFVRGWFANSTPVAAGGSLLPCVAGGIWGSPSSARSTGALRHELEPGARPPRWRACGARRADAAGDDIQAPRRRDDRGEGVPAAAPEAPGGEGGGRRGRGGEDAGDVLEGRTRRAREVLRRGAARERRGGRVDGRARARRATFC